MGRMDGWMGGCRVHIDPLYNDIVAVCLSAQELYCLSSCDQHSDVTVTELSCVAWGQLEEARVRAGQCNYKPNPLVV